MNTQCSIYAFVASSCSENMQTKLGSCPAVAGALGRSFGVMPPVTHLQVGILEEVDKSVWRRYKLVAARRKNSLSLLRVDQRINRESISPLRGGHPAPGKLQTEQRFVGAARVQREQVGNLAAEEKEWRAYAHDVFRRSSVLLALRNMEKQQIAGWCPAEPETTTSITTFSGRASTAKMRNNGRRRQSVMASTARHCRHHAQKLDACVGYTR